MAQWSPGWNYGEQQQQQQQQWSPGWNYGEQQQQQQQLWSPPGVGWSRYKRPYYVLEAPSAEEVAHQKYVRREYARATGQRRNKCSRAKTYKWIMRCRRMRFLSMCVWRWRFLRRRRRKMRLAPKRDKV